MENKQYLAHIREDGAGQTVKEHLLQTAARAKAFAAAFQGEAVAEQAALAHDLGKYTAAFQRRLCENGPKVDHSTAGARALEGNKMRCAAFCAAGHHTGLPDGGAPGDGPDAPTLCGRMKRRTQDCRAGLEEIALQPVGEPRFACGYDMAFYTRMLYSCLVDADFLDTEEFMQAGRVERGGCDDIAALRQALHRYIGRWRAPAAPLDQKRCRILADCLAAGPGPKGLYTLTVPTGGGKTVSSLAFALEHAAAHRMKRVIYVIPYTSIIEQTAETFRRIVGEGNVVEHHANVDFDQRDDSDGGAERLRLAAENWDAPLIVTTSVQFFESLYANKPSRCRKLHNIAGSVVIFDEAQMIPIPHLKPCVRAIETLVRDYGATAVLCTATQPALEPFFSPGLQPREICGDPGLYEFFRRTEIRRIGRRTTAQLADDMARHRQVLAIVNTKQQAADLYGQLPEEGRFHLSTRMTPEDRQKTLGRIRQCLQQGAVCRVAATSLVEAGVDVDFPAVYRAEAGLDSIIQAAGRCNRENKRPREQSIVSVFQPEGRPPTAIAQNTAIFHEIAACGWPLDAPETIRAYFEALHQFKGEELDVQGVVAAFDRGIRGNRLPFATVAANFRIIDTDTRSILIPLGPAARQCAAALRAGTATRRQLRQAGRHIVAVYPQQFAHLVALGAAEPVGEMAILCDLSLYDPCTGLAVDPVQGQAVFF